MLVPLCWAPQDPWANSLLDGLTVSSLCNTARPGMQCPPCDWILRHGRKVENFTLSPHTPENTARFVPSAHQPTWRSRSGRSIYLCRCFRTYSIMNFQVARRRNGTPGTLVSTLKVYMSPADAISLNEAQKRTTITLQHKCCHNTL